MNIRSKVFLIFLVQNLLILGILVCVFYFFDPQQIFLTNRNGFTIIIGILTVFYILSLFYAATKVQDYVSDPLAELTAKIEILNNHELKAVNFKQITNPTTKKIVAILDSAVQALIKREKELDELTLETNKKIEDMNKKLKVDEEAAVQVFKELKEIDRMKTEFISLAAHQLRTPLLSLRWGLETLSKNEIGSLNNNQKEYVTEMSKSTNRLISLVDGLLNVSRIESGRLIIEPQPTNLHELVESVIKEVKNKDETKNKDRVIELRVPEPLPQINIDTDLVRHIYLNLIANAVKYAPADKPIIVGLIKKENTIVSSVADKGCGIPETEKGRIFQKFFRAHNALKVAPDGTGLGLYLVKELVAVLNGTIWFESTEGQGTTFYFTLPLDNPAVKSGEIKLT